MSKQNIDKYINEHLDDFSIMNTSDFMLQCFNELQPQWISVDDRLPITRAEGAHIQVSVLATDGCNVSQMDFHSGTTPTDWYEWSQYGDIEPSLITHWQPLPLPPTQEY